MPIRWSEMVIGTLVALDDDDNEWNYLYWFSRKQQIKTQLKNFSFRRHSIMEKKNTLIAAYNCMSDQGKSSKMMECTYHYNTMKFFDFPLLHLLYWCFIYCGKCLFIYVWKKEKLPIDISLIKCCWCSLSSSSLFTAPYTPCLQLSLTVRVRILQIFTSSTFETTKMSEINIFKESYETC